MTAENLFLIIQLSPLLFCIVFFFYSRATIKKLQQWEKEIEKSVKELLDLFDDDWR